MPRRRILARELTAGIVVISAVIFISSGAVFWILQKTQNEVGAVLSYHQPIHFDLENITIHGGWRDFLIEFQDPSRSPQDLEELFQARGKMLSNYLGRLRDTKMSCWGCHRHDPQVVEEWYGFLSEFEGLLEKQERIVTEKLASSPQDRLGLISLLKPLMTDGIETANNLDVYMHRHMETLQVMALGQVAAGRRFLIGIGIFVLLSLGLALVYMDRALRRPIYALLKGTREIGSGDLSYRVSINSRDEFGNLGENFNAMTARLEQQDAEIREEKEEIQQSHQELETAYSQLQANALEIEETHEELEAAYSQLQSQAIELELSNQRLEEANRVKSTFLSMVSHELRTPLSVIRGYLNLILGDDYGKPGPELKKILAVADKRARQLQFLIEEVLDLTQIEAGELKIIRQKVSFEEVIEEAMEVYQADIEKKELNCEVEIPEDLPPVFIDKRKMTQVFANLTDNAIKFSPPGRTIHLKVTQEKENLICVFWDEGIGISPDVQSRIFEPFFQVDPSDTRSYGGTGLGLTIVKEIIRGHGGQITVDSKSGKGTKFTIRFPISGEEMTTVATELAHPTPPRISPKKTTPEKIRLLVVEDDPDMVDIIQNSFVSLDILVTAVADPFQALSLVMQRDFDFILVDVMLPGMTGFDLSRVFKALTRTKGWPLIIMSAAAQKFQIDEGLQTGADAYITKPFNVSDLYQKIIEVRDRYTH